MNNFLKAIYLNYISESLIASKTPWPESASELYRPSGHRLSAKLVPTLADRGVSRSPRRIPYGITRKF
jgi:hypothetical protein